MNRILKISLICLLIVAGISLILYPIVNKYITEEKQKDMIREVKEEILNGANNKDSALNIEDKDNDISQDISSIELEESDDNEKKVSSDNLDNQTVVGIIEIEKLDIIFAIVEGTAKNNIRVAIGHMKGTSLLGQEGNCVLAGHRGGIYGQFFKYINKLESGDSVVLTDLDGKEYTYIVYESFIVNPDDVSIADNIEGKDTLTMVTCENNGKQRLVVRAELKE